MTWDLRRHLDLRAGLLIVSAAPLTGCNGPAESVDASWLRAEVTGAVETSYEGTGFFHTGSDPRVGISVKFTLNSEGVGQHAGQNLMLYRPGKGRPGEGTYALGPLATSDGSPEGFTAYYFRVVDGQAEAYTTRSGELHIRESSEARVQGEFTLGAVLYCRSATSGTPEQWCVSPNTLTPGAPEIEVTGSFVAVPPPACCVVQESRVARP